MPTKLIVIQYCNECPYYDHEYYTWCEVCTKLNRVIPSDFDRKTPIPTDCPLPAAPEDNS